MEQIAAYLIHCAGNQGFRKQRGYIVIDYMIISASDTYNSSMEYHAWHNANKIVFGDGNTPDDCKGNANCIERYFQIIKGMISSYHINNNANHC